MSEEIKFPIPKLLIVIVDRERSSKVNELLLQLDIYLHYRIRGEGTASSEILDVLGLDRKEKSVIFCVLPEHTIDDLLNLAADKLRLMSPGTGIAFTMPLSGVSGQILKILSKEKREDFNSRIESEVKRMTNTASHDLICAIINRGYSQDLMDAAKEAGATGGTVVHSRRVGADQAIKSLWGIAVQEEREIVMILTQKENKIDIMRNINNKCGLTTEAHGLVFSMPVDSVIGIDI